MVSFPRPGPLELPVLQWVMMAVRVFPTVIVPQALLP
jgi:hypothetical protein